MNKPPETLDWLVDALASHGAHPALLQVAGDRVVRLDYAALGEEVGRLAGGLQEAGARPGGRVLLYAASTPGWIRACLAALRLGCIVVPLDVQTGTAALARILADCTPDFAFTDGELLERLQEAGFAGRIWLLDAPAGTAHSDAGLLTASPGRWPASRPDDIAVLFYTSGTTGPPKGVPLRQSNLAFQIAAIRATGLLRPDDRLLLPLPLHHVYPLALGTLMPLAMGLTIVLPAAVTGPELVRALRLGDVSIIVGVPRLYEALLKGIEARLGGTPARQLLALSGLLRRWFDLRAGRLLLRPLHQTLAPRLRALASGGAALDPEVATRLAALGWDIAIGYGLTETSPLLTIKPPSGRDLDTVGRPVPGMELRIAEAEREEDLAADPPAGAAGGAEGTPDGEILARGPGVFSGYYHLEEATAAVFTPDGWFRTGDLGHFDAQGRLHVAGRLSSMIVTAAGKNVHPEDIEKHYAAHPLIADIGILACGGGLGALVVPDLAEIRARRLTPATALREAMAERAAGLPSYQRVGRYQIDETALERTRLGKIRRHLLAERFARLSAGEDTAAGVPLSVEAMGTEDRALLGNPAAAAVWQLLVQRYPDRALSPDSSTRIDLGVDSLDWLELSLEIARKTGVELHEDDIARIDSVRDLLGAAAAATPVASSTARTPIEDPEAFLSAAQRRWLAPLSPLQQRLAQLLGGLIGWVVRRWWRVEVRGVGHLQSCRQFIITPNHTSLLDPFLIGAALPAGMQQHTAWGGWTGMAFRNALFRWGCRLGRVVPVDPDRAVVSSLAFAAAMLRQGAHLVWFPEGQRSPSGELMSFRPGIGLLLDGVAVPAVPAWIEGAHESLPPGRRWPRRVRITITFGAPVSGAQLAEEGEGPDARTRIVNALERRVRACGRGDRD